jgi:hypothetical protein
MSKFSDFFKKMNKQPWFGTLKKLAPTLAGGLIGGPFAGVAVSVLQSVLGVTGDPSDPGTVDQIAAQIGSGSPDILLKLKQAEQDFLKEMKKLDIEEQDLYLQDVASAREREKVVRDKTPMILSYLAVALWLFILYAVFFTDLEVVHEQSQRDVLLYLLGVTQTLVVTAYSYYLGSSRGSLAKTEAMVAQLKNGSST